MLRPLLLVAAILFVATRLISAPTGSVRGRVTDQATGQPLTDAYVALRWPKSPLPDLPLVQVASTDENGEFSMTGLPVGMDTLEVGAGRHHLQSVPVFIAADSATIVNVALRYGGFTSRVNMFCPPRPCAYSEPFEPKPGKFTLAGSVRDKLTTMPVPAAIVGIDFDYTDSNDVTIRDACATVLADSLGRFIFQDLYPGTYHVFAKRSRRAVERDTVSFITVADTVYRVDFTVGQRPKE